MRCSFLGRTHQPVLHYSGSQERSNQFQQPLIADPFGDLREQSVVVDPVVGKFAKYNRASEYGTRGVTLPFTPLPGRNFKNTDIRIEMNVWLPILRAR